jgi:RNA polymerase sigma-70 factor (ECF subfamily)
VWRLLNTLQKLQPPTTRDFFNLAAAHVRRELLDLARRHSGRNRPGSVPLIDDSELGPAAPDLLPADELELWTRFHEAVERLPTIEREVFSLAFYHGWTQVQIAELFDVDERTVRRRWQTACHQLTRLVGGNLPTL